MRVSANSRNGRRSFAFYFSDMRVFRHLISRIQFFISRDKRAVVSDVLSKKRQTAVKTRLLAKIHPTDVQPASIIACIAADLRALPKVAPDAMWLERTRARLTALPHASWLPIILRQSVAFAVIVLLVTGLFFTTFVSRVQSTLAEEVGRITIHDGIVKIREADATFYREATTGDVVRVGAVVRVADDAHASLTLRDAGTVALTSGTEVAITAAKKIESLPSAKKHSSASSSVQLALLSGAITARPSNMTQTGAIAITTPTGTVASTETSFAVSVAGDGTSRVTVADDAITSSTDTVTIVPTGEVTPTEVTPGQTAEIASDAVVIEATTKPVIDTPKKPAFAADDVATAIDILRIRMFDALGYATAGDLVTARRVADRVTDGLDAELRALGVIGITDKRAEALSLAVGEHLATDDLQLMTIRDYLTTIDDIQTIITTYAVTPTLRHAVSEFELIERHRYRPTSELRRLFIALQTTNLASPAIEPTIRTLLADTAEEYGRDLARGDSLARTRALIAGMRGEPLYLSALRTMRTYAPASVRYLIDREIVAQTETLRTYRGEVTDSTAK